MMKLKDKVVVITGAAGGIGRCLVVESVKRGALVVALDQNDDQLREIDSAVGVGGMLKQVDVTRESELMSLRDAIIERYGRVDVLINNAGITVLGRFEQLSAEEIEQQMSVNLRAVIASTRIFLPVLLAQPRAHVVQMASMAAMQGMPYQSIYCTTKAAVRAFAQALRAELSGSGVGVTAVLPGATRSGILTNATTHEPLLTESLPTMLAEHGAPPEKLARRILNAVEKNRAEVRFGFDCYAFGWATRIAPGLVRWSMGWIARRAEAKRIEIEQSELTNGNGAGSYRQIQRPAGGNRPY